MSKYPSPYESPELWSNPKFIASIQQQKIIQNSRKTAQNKIKNNAYVSNQRLKNQQGYKNNTSAMKDLRKKLAEISKKIFTAKEADWNTNTSTLEAEKQQLLNQLSTLEGHTNGIGGRRTHKKRRSSRTCKRSRSN